MSAIKLGVVIIAIYGEQSGGSFWTDNGKLYWNASQYPTSVPTNENIKVCAQLSLKKEKIKCLS